MISPRRNVLDLMRPGYFGTFWGSAKGNWPQHRILCGPGPGGGSTAPGRAIAAPAAVFSCVSTPEAQPHKGKRARLDLSSGHCQGALKCVIDHLDQPPGCRGAVPRSRVMRRPAGRVRGTRARQPLGFGPNRVVLKRAATHSETHFDAKSDCEQGKQHCGVWWCSTTTPAPPHQHHLRSNRCQRFHF